MGIKNMVHLNGHMMCAVDVETTGLRAGYHDLIQVCFLPLDNKLEPRQDLPIFDMAIKPTNVEKIDMKAMSVNRTKLGEILESGFEPETAFDMFEHWWQRINMPENKRITPLAHNWPFDRSFLIEWMGWENFNHYIDGRYRDTMMIPGYQNDRSDFQAEQTPFAGSVTLNAVANRLGVEVIEKRTHDAMYDCLITAQVYKALCKDHFE